MSWDDVWGHEQTIGILQRLIAQGRLSQSLLLSGPPSIGKRLVAERLAQALTCSSPVAPCGTCSSCRAVSAHQQMDCQWIEPSGPTTQVPVEVVREALRRLHQTPAQGQRQIAVFITVEQLQDEAAHTLLKTIEEPPLHAQLILTTHDVGRCLPTIVSRCHVLRLHPWSREALAEQLAKARQLQPAMARHIAFLAEGRAGKALQLVGAKDVPTAQELFEVLDDDKSWSAARRESLFRLLEQYVWWCRDSLCRLTDCDELAGLPAERSLAARQPRDLTHAAEVLEEALHLLEALEQRVNPKLVQWKLQQRWTGHTGRATSHEPRATTHG